MKRAGILIENCVGTTNMEQDQEHIINGECWKIGNSIDWLMLQASDADKFAMLVSNYKQLAQAHNRLGFLVSALMPVREAAE
jgi:hypothetical protein